MITRHKKQLFKAWTRFLEKSHEEKEAEEEEDTEEEEE